VYSADLSKATDHISVETASAIVDAVLDETNAPQWMRDGAKSVIRNVGLHGLVSRSDGTVTTCGALMGLGPSWTVMSILNCYAATKAGASPDSFAVNGDDLIAFWSPKICDRYETYLRKVRLVPNIAKSFRGKCGVFCEMFAEIQGGNLVCRPMYRLGEASGVKSIEGRRADLVADDLRDIAEGKVPNGWRRTHRVIRSLAYQTLKSVTNTKMPGPRALGGSGIGTLDYIGAADFILHGRSPTRTKRRTVGETDGSRARLADLAAAPHSNKLEGIRYADLQALRGAHDGHVLRTGGDWINQCRAQKVCRRDRDKRMRCRRHAARLVGPFAALKTAGARERWDATVRAKAHKYFKLGRFQLGTQFLASHTRWIANEELVPLYPLSQRRLQKEESPTWGPGPQQ
jgi:hypothetical protein